MPSNSELPAELLEKLYNLYTTVLTTVIDYNDLPWIEV